jgi:hypothetical protein
LGRGTAGGAVSPECLAASAELERVQKRTTVERSDERRKYSRLHLDLPIHISGTDAAGRTLEENSLTVNVSARGAYFTSQTPFRAPMELSVSISVPYSVWGKLPFPRLEAPAKVVRVESPPFSGPSESEKWGVAVCFEEALSTTFEAGRSLL